MKMTHYHWCGVQRDIRNFGDALGPLLLRRFAELETEWAPLADANMISVGSLLDALPSGWSGIVLGSGQLRETTRADLSNARVLGLRGPLTARLVKGVHGRFVIGDPGLLADELIEAPEKLHSLGIVPHWSDTQLEHRHEFKRFNPLIIRPSQDPLEVIRQIGQCRKIVASSLHGVIVADAFGIPRRTEMTPRFSREGGDFKFRDHCAAVGVPFLVGVTQEAPRSLVNNRKHELYDMLEGAAKLLMGLKKL